MRKKICLAVCVAIPFMTVLPPAAAEGLCINASASERPRTGLVLGGGGARGAAHIGVIRRLEELNIPVDFVAGTSMGSLVGALYATGMNADELEQTVTTLDWDELFNDNTRREDIPWRRKRDDDLSLFGPKVGVGKDSSLLPRGAISGQQISFLFESLVSGRVQTSDFDDLPVPYRAIAADIATGETVVLDGGNLALAMRSSMSVPGVFDPVEHDGHLLVDGGIANNLPVDVVRAMGADRLIVINVGSPLTPRNKLNNLVSVFGQMSSLLIAKNVEAQLATLGAGDVLISPDLENVSSADFDKSVEAIEAGYRAADAVSARLADMSVSVAEHVAHRAAIEGCTVLPAPIQFVRLQNGSRFSDSMILDRLHVEQGKPLDTAALEKDIKQIYALGFLDLVRYETVTENGQTGVVVHVSQDARGASFLEWGLDYSGDEGDSKTSLRLAFLKTDLDELGSELRVLTQLGDDPGIMGEIYKPIDSRQRWIFRPKLYANRSQVTTYSGGGDALNTFQIDQFGGNALILREFGRHAAVSLGVSRVTGEAKVEIGDPTIPLRL